MIYEYPAIFTIEEDDPEWYNVKFPDIMCGVTCGKGMDNAIFMAKDLLYYMLTEAPKQCLPPSKVEELEKEYPGQTIVFIEVEIEEVVDC